MKGRGMLRLAAHYIRFNLSASMAYSTSFLIQVAGMALNNSAFIIFWLVLFERIGGDIAGYAFADVMFLWSLAATGFGLGVVLFGNSLHLSRIIYSGELDVYLLQPKPVLPNLLMGRSMTSGWGDLAYGLILFVATQPLTPATVILFALFSVALALVLVAVRVLYHSLSFRFGNAEGFAGLTSELMISFMLYPGSIFRGPTSWLLHSLIPVAIVAYIPARIIRVFDPVLLLVVLAADAAIVAISVLVFRMGLKRYESGNLIGTRM